MNFLVWLETNSLLHKNNFFNAQKTMVVGSNFHMVLRNVAKMMINNRRNKGKTVGRARRAVMKARLVDPLARAMLLRLCTHSA